MFIHLTAHSAYSLQEGLALPAELAQAAAAAGMPALGLTDHRLLTGSVEFVAACKRNGLQPLLGLEIDLESGPLSLLAMNMDGWSNLCRLSSALALRDEPEAACPPDLLAACSDGLIALRVEAGEAAIDRLGRLAELFPGRLYVALQDPATALQAVSLARKLGLPTVVTHPLYYLQPAQAGLQRTLAAIRLNRPVGRLPEAAAAPAGAHFIPADEMEARFEHFPAALEATAEIAAALPLRTAAGPPPHADRPAAARKVSRRILAQQSRGRGPAAVWRHPSGCKRTARPRVGGDLEHGL